MLSWSAVLADFDLDGHDELFIVNGETSPGNTPPVVMLSRGAELPYRELSPEIPCMDARGQVASDLDGDGDPDVVIAQREGPLSIYENRGTPTAGWIGVTLHGQVSNRDGVGAVVTLRLASGRTLMRVIGAGGVVHTASPVEAHFGFGADSVAAISVRWPSGTTSELLSPATETTLVITE